MKIIIVGNGKVGYAIARQLAVADRTRTDALDWLKAGGWSTEPSTPAQADGPGVRLIARYAADLAELLDDTEGTA